MAAARRRPAPPGRRTGQPAVPGGRASCSSMAASAQRLRSLGAWRSNHGGALPARRRSPATRCGATRRPTTPRSGPTRSTSPTSAPTTDRRACAIRMQGEHRGRHRHARSVDGDDRRRAVPVLPRPSDDAPTLRPAWPPDHTDGHLDPRPAEHAPSTCGLLRPDAPASTTTTDPARWSGRSSTTQTSVRRPGSSMRTPGRPCSTRGVSSSTEPARRRTRRRAAPARPR